MSRTIRTKRTLRSKGSRLHHNVGKTDDVENLGPFEKPCLPHNISKFYENRTLNFSGSAEDLEYNFETLSE